MLWAPLDLRQNGEDGVSVNLQVETFVVDSGGEIASTLAGLVAAIGKSESIP